MPTPRTPSGDSRSTSTAAKRAGAAKSSSAARSRTGSAKRATNPRGGSTPAPKTAPADKPPRDPRINTRVAPRVSEREVLSTTRRNAGRAKTTTASASDTDPTEQESRSTEGKSLDELLGTSVGDRAAMLPVRREPRRNPDDLGEGRVSDVNEWGRSEHMRALARRAYDPIYKHWFRVEWEGIEKIPPGGALLVANHAGAIPSDAPAIMHGIETELGRPIYGLADNFFRTVPVVGTMWSRLGGLPAHPDNAYRLLREQDQLVLVFPEGTKGPAKTFNERYKLRRFGRGGFVEIAMRAGVPVVPIAVVGAEESMPILLRLPSIAKAVGLPYVPITANMLVAGPLGVGAYFPAKFKMKVLDPVRFEVPPDQERYSRSRVMDESEAIRDRIQAALYEMLRKRRSVWFG